MFKTLVAVSLAGLLLSLGMLFDAHARFGAPVPDSHAQVLDILPGSPAERAGLTRGDVILALDGVDVPMSELRWRVGGTCAAFHTRQLTYERGHVRYTIPIRAENRRIGVHFGPATRYERDLGAAAFTAFSAWRGQARGPAGLLSLSSSLHRRSAAISFGLFWSSLATFFAALAFALRRRRP